MHHQGIGRSKPPHLRAGEVIRFAGTRRTYRLGRGHTGARDDGALTVRDISAQRVGELANQHHIAIYELTPEVATLEEAFMNLTHPAMTPNERSLVPLATGSAAR